MNTDNSDEPMPLEDNDEVRAAVDESVIIQEPNISVILITNPTKIKQFQFHLLYYIFLGNNNNRRQW